MDRNERERLNLGQMRVLNALQSAGKIGCTTAELTRIASRFGGRICELKKLHFDIRREHLQDSQWRYWLETTQPEQLTLGGV